MENELKLNRPDINMANEIKAIFEDDPNVSAEVNTIEDGSILTFKVNEYKKAAGIRKMLEEKYEIGNLTLEVKVVDISSMNEDIIHDVFDSNPHFNRFTVIPDPLDPNVEYRLCIFNKEVIQFPNDNAGSLHGYESRLMEDLANEVLDCPTLMYTTDDGIDD